MDKQKPNAKLCDDELIEKVSKARMACWEIVQYLKTFNVK